MTASDGVVLDVSDARILGDVPIAFSFSFLLFCVYAFQNNPTFVHTHSKTSFVVRSLGIHTLYYDSQMIIMMSVFLRVMIYLS